MKAKTILTNTSVSCKHSNSSSFQFIRFAHLSRFCNLCMSGFSCRQVFGVLHSKFVHQMDVANIQFRDLYLLFTISKVSRQFSRAKEKLPLPLGVFIDLQDS